MCCVSWSMESWIKAARVWLMSAYDERRRRFNSTKSKSNPRGEMSNLHWINNTITYFVNKWFLLCLVDKVWVESWFSTIYHYSVFMYNSTWSLTWSTHDNTSVDKWRLEVTGSYQKVRDPATDSSGRGRSLLISPAERGSSGLWSSKHPQRPTHPTAVVKRRIITSPPRSSGSHNLTDQYCRSHSAYKSFAAPILTADFQQPPEAAFITFQTSPLPTRWEHLAEGPSIRRDSVLGKQKGQTSPSCPPPQRRSLTASRPCATCFCHQSWKVTGGILDTTRSQINIVWTESRCQLLMTSPLAHREQQNSTKPGNNLLFWNVNQWCVPSSRLVT